MKRLFLLIVFSFFLIDLQSQNTYSYTSGNNSVTIPCGFTHTFIDDGGTAAGYGGNLNYTVTFLPSTPGQCIKLSITTFSVHSSETFSIYDGPNSSSNLIGTYN